MMFSILAEELEGDISPDPGMASPGGACQRHSGRAQATVSSVGDSLVGSCVFAVGVLFFVSASRTLEGLRPRLVS
jgi:hypothetical protein